MPEGVDFFWFSWSSQLVTQYVPPIASHFFCPIWLACPTVVILDPIPIAGPLLELFFSIF